MSKPRRPRRVVSGIVLLDKPKGMTSNSALLEVRRLYQADKAGHTGSLDPMATGLLPVCLGQATKLCGYLLDADKRYLATVRLGQKTDTGDADGQVIAEADLRPISRAELVATLATFVGPQTQIPPMYSALKQGGERLYAMAREGRTVSREPREIDVRHLALVSMTEGEWVLDITCSKGTYIRVLAEDIAAQLGQLAHLVGLRRLEVEPFLGEMLTLADLQARAQKGHSALDHALLPLSMALSKWPQCRVTLEQAITLRKGQPVVAREGGHSGFVAVLDERGVLACVGEQFANGELWSRRWLQDDSA